MGKPQQRSLSRRRSSLAPPSRAKTLLHISPSDTTLPTYEDTLDAAISTFEHEHLKPRRESQEIKEMTNKLEQLADQAAHNRLKVEEISSRVGKLLDDYNEGDNEVGSPYLSARQDTELDTRKGSKALELLIDVNNSLIKQMETPMEADEMEDDESELLSTPRCVKMLNTVLDSTSHAKERLENALTNISKHVHTQDQMRVQQIDTMRYDLDTYTEAIEKAKRQAANRGREIDHLTKDIKKLSDEKHMLLSNISEVRSESEAKIRSLSTKITELIAEKDALKRKNVQLVNELKQKDIDHEKELSMERQKFQEQFDALQGPSEPEAEVTSAADSGSMTDLLVSGTSSSKPTQRQQPPQETKPSLATVASKVVRYGVPGCENTPKSRKKELCTMKLQMNSLEKEKEAATRKQEQSIVAIRRLENELNIVKTKCRTLVLESDEDDVDDKEIYEKPVPSSQRISSVPIIEMISSDGVIPRRRRNTIDRVPVTFLETTTIVEEANEGSDDESDDGFSDSSDDEDDDDETPQDLFSTIQNIRNNEQRRRNSIDCIPRSFALEIPVLPPAATDNPNNTEDTPELIALKRQIADMKMQRDAYLSKLSVVKSENDHLKSCMLNSQQYGLKTTASMLQAPPQNTIRPMGEKSPIKQNELASTSGETQILWRKSFSEKLNDKLNPSGIHLTAIRQNYLNSLKAPAAARTRRRSTGRAIVRGKIAAVDISVHGTTLM